MSEGYRQYTTLISDTCDGLDKKVNDYIEDGWEPYGNPYIFPECSINNRPVFCQAVVKKIYYVGGIGGGR